MCLLKTHRTLVVLILRLQTRKGQAPAGVRQVDGTELLLSPEQWILHLLLNANTVLSLFFFSVRILRVICPFRAPLVTHSPGEGRWFLSCNHVVCFSLHTLRMYSLDSPLE